ncbi:alpha/beta fold hydrolase [Streptomyces netropsis]|uniref:Acetyl esterase/lipase n=1 Tax=Streptomyces netropsis TaxID=55404 RepID=A0A7W7LDD0_STRNE|nr:alpha/beta fold hydrolase [Streptomyces netropsis]MBB4888143.1 acetyl esterase/lipase [Streptomyces netropsis]GGR31801.1 esterase [Streptomyces netropsis]
MTAFILVSGAYTGGWVWREVAARLRESGAEVHPVTLTGMGDRRHPAGPETDLETHIQDLVRLIDHVDAPEVVIVGHCYGIHPVLGAADRRPERIARIVYLDAGMPRDGDPALELVPDRAVRDRLLHRAEQTEDDGLIAPPSLDEWQRWGSTAGIPADALERLVRRAAPQPLGTLTQPLRLSEAVSGLPMTGVLCTDNGSGIAMVESLVGLGDPRFQALIDPQVSFFELDTGHWPMLSTPDELAEVLLRAAAGEGHRLAAPSGHPAHLRRFLMEVPERPRERVGRVDLYLPDADRPRPAVVFVHGGPVPAGVRPTPRDWPTYVGYGRYVASLGAVGVTLDHRLHDLADFERAAEDVAEAVELVRADPRVDGERVALWYFSSGGLLSADWLAAPPPWLRCVAATYPILAPPPNWGLAHPRFRPAAAVRAAGRLPIVLTRVGLENAGIAMTVEEFLTAAKECEADVEVIDVPLGHHGFETVDHTEQAREAVERAVRSVLGHLRN